MLNKYLLITFYLLNTCCFRTHATAPQTNDTDVSSPVIAALQSPVPAPYTSAVEEAALLAAAEGAVALPTAPVPHEALPVTPAPAVSNPGDAALARAFYDNGYSAPDPGGYLYPQIQKVDNELYFAKIPGRPLFLAIERVTEKNKDSWEEYARQQSNAGKKISNKINLSDGSGYFYEALQCVPFDKNEIWVCYITTNPIPDHIPFLRSIKLGKENYPLMHTNVSKNLDEIILAPTVRTFTKGIQMFVTVTTNPEALITSHMGVAMSYEAALRKFFPKFHPGETYGHISIDLHSFGAKVMRMRNPHRRYMITSPVHIMRRLLAEIMPPDTFFIGTPRQRTSIQVIFDAGQYHMERLTTKGFSVLDNLCQNYPKMILVDEVNDTGDTFLIYDTPFEKKPDQYQQVWLKIGKKSDIYNWFFLGPFSANFEAPYIAANLQALADAKPVEAPH